MSFKIVAYILVSQLLKIWLEKERTETFQHFMNSVEGRGRFAKNKISIKT